METSKSELSDPSKYDGAFNKWTAPLYRIGCTLTCHYLTLCDLVFKSRIASGFHVSAEIFYTSILCMRKIQNDLIQLRVTNIYNNNKCNCALIIEEMIYRDSCAWDIKSLKRGNEKSENVISSRYISAVILIAKFLSVLFGCVYTFGYVEINLFSQKHIHDPSGRY